MEEPGFYTSANQQQRNDAEYVIEEYLDEIGEISGLCLDVGSGPGDVVADLLLPKLNPKATIVCSDISESMVKFGKQKYKNNERVSFVKLDIETTDLPEDLIGKFDHVWSFYCLHWCQDMRQVFENIFELLQPGGTALLLFLTSHPVYSAYEILAAMPCFQPYTKDVSRYIPVFQHAGLRCANLKSILKDTGFDVRHCSCREKTQIFSSIDAVRKTFLAINPFLRRMPVDLREVYIEELIREVMKQFCIRRNHSANDENEYSIVTVYHIFVVHLKKPLGKQ